MLRRKRSRCWLMAWRPCSTSARLMQVAMSALSASRARRTNCTEEIQVTGAWLAAIWVLQRANAHVCASWSCSLRKRSLHARRLRPTNGIQKRASRLDAPLTQVVIWRELVTKAGQGSLRLEGECISVPRSPTRGQPGEHHIVVVRKGHLHQRCVFNHCTDRHQWAEPDSIEELWMRGAAKQCQKLTCFNLRWLLSSLVALNYKAVIC